jgi:hypothetical protein
MEIKIGVPIEKELNLLTGHTLILNMLLVKQSLI